MDGEAIVPPVVETNDCLLGTLFILELQSGVRSLKWSNTSDIHVVYLDVNISHQVVSKVVTHVHLFNTSILCRREQEWQRMRVMFMVCHSK